MSQHGCPERLSNRSKGFQEDGQSQPTMEVLVETLTGTAFEMTVSPSDTIFAIKSKIFRVEGIPVSQQHLLYNLKELEDSSSLREHAISDGARLRLVLGMCGGPITTRRLPPPPSEPWRDIERLLDSNREDSDWGGNGCKVTVLVFREGERVNMVRVRENRDGSYSPLDHNKFEVGGAESLSHLLEAEAEAEAEGEEVAGALHENAVTMGKMMDLRRRMENLSLQRRGGRAGDKAEIQKTRSEETLSVPSLLDDSVEQFTNTYTPYSEAEDSFAPLYDGNYTRYDYDCSFADRYSLLPPIGTRTDSEPSVQEAGDGERLSALAGSILVKGREDEAAILEECLDGVEECRLRQDSPQLAAKNLAPIPAAEYGPLVGGVGAGGWRNAAFGSAGGLGALGVTPPPLRARAAHHSAGALHVRAPRRPAPLSSSTPDLEQLARHRYPRPHHSAGALHVRAPRRPAPLSSSTPDLEQLARHRYPRPHHSAGALHVRAPRRPAPLSSSTPDLEQLARHRYPRPHHSAGALHVRAPRRPAPLSSSTPDLEQLARHRYPRPHHSAGALHVRAPRRPAPLSSSTPDLEQLARHRYPRPHHSAGALHVRAPRRPAPLSSSTPDLEQLARHRILPALSRHRNREHLHLSDEGLDTSRAALEVGSERRQRRLGRAPPRARPAPPPPAPEPPPPPPQEVARRVRCLVCRRRLSIATVHVCRCGGRYCAPHRYAEVHGCNHDYKAAP